MSDPRASDGLQRRQIHLAVLARKRDVSAALVLLHPGDTMITGVKQLDLVVAIMAWQFNLRMDRCQMSATFCVASPRFGSHAFAYSTE